MSQVPVLADPKAEGETCGSARAGSCKSQGAASSHSPCPEVGPKGTGGEGVSLANRGSPTGWDSGVCRQGRTGNLRVSRRVTHCQLVGVQDAGEKSQRRVTGVALPQGDRDQGKLPSRSSQTVQATSFHSWRLGWAQVQEQEWDKRGGTALTPGSWAQPGPGRCICRPSSKFPFP